uniref:Glycosyltransferase RgtA/B/C/D-like domain-containing protein n=1 Tax=uncultured bacterium 213 TaxID=698383 RepID=E3T6X2_9BACT|nr:hypothetical protein [uncultured bacterium 213]
MDRSTARVIIFAGLLAAISSAVLGWLWFGWSPFDTDTGSYLFQAKLFARGLLSVPAPDDLGLIPSGSFNAVHGKWYAKSAWGNALALTAGVLVHAPWLVPAVETGLALIVLCVFVERVFNRETAFVTAALLLISPAMVGVGATWASEATSRLALAVYLLGLADVVAAWQRRESPTVVDGLMLGGGLGFALCIRPLTALAFALPGAAFCGWALASARPSVPQIVRPMATAGAAFTVFVASLLAYNAVLTGHALTFTQNAEQTLNGLGFGPRGDGYDVPDFHPAAYTPRIAISRTFRHTLPAVSFAALGWGYYRPDLFNPVGAALESAVGGLSLTSQARSDWVMLVVRGASNGPGRVTLDSRHFGALESWGSVVLDRRDGTADLRLRIASAPEGYRAFVSAPNDSEWRAVGTIPWRLDEPIDVGPFASRVSARDPLSVTYRNFVVAKSDAGDLKSDGFAAGPGAWWRWSREPIEWGGASPGVRVVSNVHHSLHTDELQPALLGEYVNRLVQPTSGSTFDVAVDVSADWRPGDRLPWLRAAPLLLVPLLVVVALTDRWRNPYDWLLAGCIVASLIGFGLFFFEGSTLGRTPTHSRYHNEATVLAILPLVARGLVAVLRRVRDRHSRPLRFALLAAAALLCLNTVASFAAIGRDYRNWNDVFQQLPRLVSQSGVHHAVVFLPNSHAAPIGDYPFEPLDRADIVYYRFGAFPEWGLMERPLRDVYPAYFQGRRAFLYEHEELRELDVGR